jgi:transcriptional regulator of aromatic amino acid metabolism
VPVLYGPVEYLAESAVTVLLNSLLQTDKQCKISDCELRRPSHVDDIADICLQMAVKRLEVSVLYGIGTVYFNYPSSYKKGKKLLCISSTTTATYIMPTTNNDGKYGSD